MAEARECAFEREFLGPPSKPAGLGSFCRIDAPDRIRRVNSKLQNEAKPWGQAQAWVELGSRGCAFNRLNGLGKSLLQAEETPATTAEQLGQFELRGPAGEFEKGRLLGSQALSIRLGRDAPAAVRSGGSRRTSWIIFFKGAAGILSARGGRPELRLSNSAAALS